MAGSTITASVESSAYRRRAQLRQLVLPLLLLLRFWAQVEFRRGMNELGLHLQPFAIDTLFDECVVVVLKTVEGQYVEQY